MSKDKKLIELQQQLSQIQEMIRMSEIYGGKIKLEKCEATTEELLEMEEHLKHEIAAKISNSPLRIITNEE